MNSSANRDYLEQRVKTASSAQLHLMLIDGAIRFADQADKAFEANDADAAAHPLKRAMDIVSELLAGVKHSQDDINEKLASLYQFVFTRLTMAYVNTDRQKLGESLQILRFQQETWRAALEKAMAEQAESEGKAAAADTPIAEGPKGPHKPPVIGNPLADASLPASDGLSLEA
ncbi:MAG: flagellar export chaperone FliS [Planctomycetota bacterium]